MSDQPLSVETRDADEGWFCTDLCDHAAGAYHCEKPCYAYIDRAGRCVCGLPRHAHSPMADQPKRAKRTVGVCYICQLLVDALHAMVRDKRGLAHHQCVADRRTSLTRHYSDGTSNDR